MGCFHRSGRGGRGWDGSWRLGCYWTESLDATPLYPPFLDKRTRALPVSQGFESGTLLFLRVDGAGAESGFDWDRGCDGVLQEFAGFAMYRVVHWIN